MTEPGNIFKSGGHCYGPMGYPDCAYWDKVKCVEHHVGDTKARCFGFLTTRCLLFGGVGKDASRALECCDRIYGKDYEGRA